VLYKIRHAQLTCNQTVSGRRFQPCPMEMHSNVNDGDVDTRWLLGTRPNHMRIDIGHVRNVQCIQFWKNADQTDNVTVG